MAPNPPDRARLARGEPRLADLVARRLAGTALAWATRPILGALAIVVIVALFVAWFVILAVFGMIAGALGLTAAAGGGAVVVVGLVVSSVALALPVRRTIRNLLRAERRLVDTAETLAIGTTVDRGITASATRPAPLTSADLRALDARLAAPPSVDREGVPEQPDR